VLNPELADSGNEVGVASPSSQVHLHEDMGHTRVVLPLLLAPEDVSKLEQQTAAGDIDTGRWTLRGWDGDGARGELLRGREGVRLKVVKERELSPSRDAELGRPSLDAPPALVDDLAPRLSDVP
jgi:hypothetical protein